LQAPPSVVALQVCGMKASDEDWRFSNVIANWPLKGVKVV
jgi:hypothetical protein